MTLSRREINKDVVQQSVEAATHTAGQVFTIVLGAVREVTQAVGGLATEIFEIREAAGRASDDSPEDPRDTTTVEPG